MTSVGHYNSGVLDNLLCVLRMPGSAPTMLLCGDRRRTLDFNSL